MLLVWCVQRGWSLTVWCRKAPLSYSHNESLKWCGPWVGCFFGVKYECCWGATLAKTLVVGVTPTILDGGPLCFMHLSRKCMFPNIKLVGENHFTLYLVKGCLLAIKISRVCPCWIETNVGKLCDTCWFFVLHKQRDSWLYWREALPGW